MKINTDINSTIYTIGDSSTVTVKGETVTVYDSLLDRTSTYCYRPDVASDMGLAIAQLLERGYKLIGGYE